MNLEIWREWDEMIQHAGENGIYIGSFEGPWGKYGGQWRGKYPPSQLVMNPGIQDQVDYTYDYAGNRLTRDIPSTLYAGNDRDQKFTYDGLHRL